MQFEAVSDLDGFRRTFKCEDSRVSGAKFRSVGTGEGATLQGVVAALDRKRNSHGYSGNDRGRGGDGEALLRLGAGCGSGACESGEHRKGADALAAAGS